MSPSTKGPLLVIEDSPSDLELTLRAFCKQMPGERVEVVRDGAEALDFLFCRGTYACRKSLPSPRVILMDLKLPKVNGIEVLRQIKSNSQTREIPVVVFSSSAQQRDIDATYRLGVNSYIVKPVEFELFSQAVMSVGHYWLTLNQSPR